MRSTLLASALGLLLLACGGDTESAPRQDRTPSAGPTPPEPEFVSIAGGVAWRAEAPFSWARPDNDMRDAQYSVEEVPGAVLTVSHFDPAVGGGGDVTRNVQRWTGQFELAAGAAPATQQRHINDLDVTTVDIRGTFVGRQGRGPAGPPRPDWRLLGAIVRGEHGLVFFKLLGPADRLDDAARAFESLLESIHPA